MSGRDGGEAPAAVRSLREQIVADILAELAPYLPRTALVDGRDGGNVRVSFDGEARDARAVGFPAPKGVRPERDQRAIVQRTASGEDVIASLVTDAEGAGRQAVGNDELYDNAVDKRVLQPNSVGADHLVGGAVERRHVGPKAIGNNELDVDLDGGRVKPGSTPRNRLDNDTQSRITGAVQDGEFQDAARKGKPSLATGDDVKSGDAAVGRDLDAVEKNLGRDISGVKADLGKLRKDLSAVRRDIPDVPDTSGFLELGDLPDFATKADLERLRKDMQAFTNDKFKAARRGT